MLLKIIRGSGQSDTFHINAALATGKISIPDTKIMIKPFIFVHYYFTI